LNPDVFVPSGLSIIAGLFAFGVAFAFGVILAADTKREEYIREFFEFGLFLAVTVFAALYVAGVVVNVERSD
jgi:hypothetical protein